MGVFVDIEQVCGRWAATGVAVALFGIALNLFADVGWRFGKAVF